MKTIQLKLGDDVYERLRDATDSGVSIDSIVSTDRSHHVRSDWSCRGQAPVTAEGLAVLILDAMYHGSDCVAFPDPPKCGDCRHIRYALGPGSAREHGSVRLHVCARHVVHQEMNVVDLDDEQSCFEAKPTVDPVKTCGDCRYVCERLIPPSPDGPAYFCTYRVDALASRLPISRGAKPCSHFVRKSK